MESEKKKILLVWGYHRKGWVEVFNRLAADFRFELLFYIHKPELEVNFTDFPVHYWSDFKSAWEIIDRIQPEKVVFMSTEGIPSTALNTACKSKGIETIVLAHGMFHSFESYILDEKLQTEWALSVGRKTHHKKNDPSTNRSLLKFYMRSIPVLKWIPAMIYLLRLRMAKKKTYEIVALRQLKSALRITDKYLVFTRSNAQFLVDRDGVREEAFIEIGNPEFDEYTESLVTDQPYILYIHSPLTQITEYDSEGFMEQEAENAFIAKLNRHAKKQGYFLYVKLHPYSYDNPGLLQDENITYFRDVRNEELILGAKKIFGFNSTLILAAAYFKEVCLFTLDELSHVQEDLAQLGMVRLLPFRTFKEEELDREDPQQQQREEFIRRYLYQMDGKALERLKTALNA